MSIIDVIREGVTDVPSPNRPAGIEIRQELAPAAGAPVSPPSYQGELEIHERHIDGERRTVIELDSVGSSANRIEEALLDEYRAGRYPLPVSKTTITAGDQVFEITTLEAPHRVYDAWIRLSTFKGDDTPFEATPQGRELSLAHASALDPILEASAHDLLLGAWDSHRSGPTGQVRIARSFVSTVLGFDPLKVGTRAARRDPLNIGDEKDVKIAKGAGLKLSEQGLSSIPPIGRRPGVSISSARFVGFLSFPALRRLRFERYDDVAVRTALAALLLHGLLLRQSAGWSLRSECELVPSGDIEMAIVRNGSAASEPFTLTLDESAALLRGAVEAAGIADRSASLIGGPKLTELVARAIAADVPPAKA